MVTTNWDIAAWAMVAVGAEPFLVSAMGTYMPLLLEQLARNNGVSPIDHLTPCTTRLEDPLPPPPTSSALFGASSTNACVLPVLGGRLYIDTSSYALYTFSFAVLLQTLCVMTVSGIADNSNNKRQLLIIFGLLGGVSGCMFVFVGSRNYYLASILSIIGNCSFGVVNVLINSYLISLIDNYQRSPEETPLLSSEGVEAEAEEEEEEHKLGKIGAKISGIGTSSGYTAALVIQILSLFELLMLKKINDSMVWCTKIVIACVGLWWVFWQLPIYKYLRNLGTANNEANQHLSYLTMIFKGYHEIYHAITSIKDLKHVYFFLLGWFVLADSISTINSTAMLFAKTSLNMSMVAIGIMGVLVMISAIAGSILIPQIVVAKGKWDLQHVLVGIVVWSLAVPLYGLFFLSKPWELYVLGVWYGIGLGGLSTVSRSIYSLIIPKGKENVFFAIFSLTDKSSSIIGPFVVGLVINVLHDIRTAFWILSGLLILSIPIIGFKFNFHEARLKAQKFV